RVVGDPLRLRQVLSNLLANALKFTDRGRVGISVSLVSAKGQEPMLHFAVTDTGIGISPADQQRIFTPFAQVDSSSTRRHGGVGLGLAIASDLISAMRGRLSLVSEVGQGSTFSFAIPLVLAGQDAEIAPVANFNGHGEGQAKAAPTERAASDHAGPQKP